MSLPKPFSAAAYAMHNRLAPARMPEMTVTGRFVTNGAVSGRYSHQHPNIEERPKDGSLFPFAEFSEIEERALAIELSDPCSKLHKG